MEEVWKGVPTHKFVSDAPYCCDVNVICDIDLANVESFLLAAKVS